MDEPLLTPTLNRFILFPIKYPDIWKMAKQQEASFWSSVEIDMNGDRKDLLTLSVDEQNSIKKIIAFFAAADGIVNENLSVNFSNEIQCSEGRYFYSFQSAIESVHSEVYGLLIDTYITDLVEKDNLFNSIKTNPFIKNKAEWAIKWFDRKNSYYERIIAFACVEGIFFSASFAFIFWIKQRGILKGLCFSNELISRDEALHCEFACLLYSKLIYKLSFERISEIVKSAVELEIEFIKSVIPVNLKGMNAILMEQYIKFCADFWMIKLGYSKIYNSENPFDFMTNISLEAKDNFFEKVNSSYAKFGVGIEKEQMLFSTEEEF